MSLKFVPKVRINNIPSLVQIMAWRRPGDKPLFEPMMVSLPTHICVTRPQWVSTVFVYTKLNFLVGERWAEMSGWVMSMIAFVVNEHDAECQKVAAFDSANEISTTSHECYGISKHWQFKICSTTCPGSQHRNHQSCTLLVLCEGNPLVTGRYSSQSASSNVKSVLMLISHLENDQIVGEKYFWRIGLMWRFLIFPNNCVFPRW